MKKHDVQKCFDFFKKKYWIFKYLHEFLTNHWLVNNRPYQAIAIRVDINSDKTLFYPFTVSVNKCAGIFNAIDDLYIYLCMCSKIK